MNHQATMESEVSAELLVGFLGRMSAPEPEEGLVLEQPDWWHRGAALGTVAGLALGLLVFWIGTSGRATSPAARAASLAPSTDARLGHDPGLPPATGLATASADQPGAEPTASGPLEVESPSRLLVPGPPAISRAPGGLASFGPLQAGPRPAVPIALLRRGWRMYHRGDYHAAAVAFGRAVHKNPYHTGGYYGLSLSLFEQGKEDVALQVLERGAKKVGPKADLWVLAGSIYQWMGKERMARMAYQRYLTTNPRGAYARDVRVILSHPELPKLLPFDDDASAALVQGEP